MAIDKLWKKLYFLSLVKIVFLCISLHEGYSQSQPNILWIVSEDNSPWLGAYGDTIATTPNIDKLAEQGFVYINAYSNAPVCAPARNTIITGVYANSSGNQHMRSRYRISDEIVFFPQLLRQVNYYATNNAKEDYNIDTAQTSSIWDESSNQAHYKNRKLDQPFFAVFNSGLTHEGQIHNRIPISDIRHEPASITIPPYLPDTPDIRHDIVQYYDHIENMDVWVGEILQELEDSGEAENTIVFYYGDHGGVYPRSKRYVYDTGTQVPLIIRIPEQYREFWPEEHPGTIIDRLVSFVDLAPTLLSLAGAKIPEFMQGEPFLGEQKTADPDYVYMFRGRMDERYDMSRAVRGKQFRYIRNYMPYRIYGQKLDYLWRAPAMTSWEQTCMDGGCNETQNRFWNTKPVEELYDSQKDPWEVNNLVDDPEYDHILVQMRKAARKWMLDIYDTGFLPEAEMIERSGGQPMYNYMRSEQVKLEQIYEAADRATFGSGEDLPDLISYLSSEDSAVRYWGATGLLMLGELARGTVEELKVALNDPSASVGIVASEALYGLGEVEVARQGFARALQSPNSFARTHVLNVIDSLNDDSYETQQAVIKISQQIGELNFQEYDHRAMAGLLDKWNIDLKIYNIEVDW